MNKYGKSVNDRDCIGPCTKKYNRILHPITLNIKYLKFMDSCPVYPFLDKDTKELSYYDQCKNATSVKNKDDEIDAILPHMDYSIKYFINTFYDISSFEDMLEWLNNNKKASIFTKLRIIKYTIKVYNDYTGVIDDILVNTFVEIIKKLWIANIYNVVHKYMKSDNGQIIISNKLDTDEKNKDKKQKINLLIKKYTDKSYIYNFLDDYLNKYSDKEKEDINIKHELINSIVKNIM